MAAQWNPASKKCLVRTTPQREQGAGHFSVVTIQTAPTKAQDAVRKDYVDERLRDIQTSLRADLGRSAQSLPANSVGVQHLQNGSVGLPQLAARSVDDSKLVPGPTNSVRVTLPSGPGHLGFAELLKQVARAAPGGSVPGSFIGAGGVYVPLVKVVAYAPECATSGFLNGEPHVEAVCVVTGGVKVELTVTLRGMVEPGVIVQAHVPLPLEPDKKVSLPLYAHASLDGNPPAGGAVTFDKDGLVASVVFDGTNDSQPRTLALSASYVCVPQN